MGWWERAACKNESVKTFVGAYAHGKAGRAIALAVCEGCPVRVECLEDCLEFRMALPGVWGGTTDDDRKDRHKAREIAAGRTLQRPDPSVELPIPRSGFRAQHGSEVAYVTHKCRCDVCTQAMRKRWAAKKARAARRAAA